jgi:F-type H+-transporting ATPase subunit c
MLKNLISFNLLNYSEETEAIMKLGKLVGTGMACSGSIGAGAGVGVVWGCYLISCTQNPEVGPKNFKFAILGFALTEAVGLLALMIAFMIFFS